MSAPRAEPNFQKDLERGQAIEKEVCMVMSCYPMLADFQTKSEYEPGYDIHCSVEVKYQPDSIKCFYIENSYEGKPSGIQVTKANQWVIVDTRHYYFVPVSIIKTMIKSHRERTSDYSSTTGYVVPKKSFVGRSGVRVVERTP